MKLSFSRRWLLPVLVALYSMNYMDRSVLGIVGEALKADMGLSDAQLGMIHSILMAALILIVIPASMLNDMWSRQKAVSLCAGLWGLAMAGTAAASGFWSLTAARILGSVNEAVLAPGGAAWLVQAYPPHKRGRVLGIFEASAPLGMAFGTLLGSAVLTFTGSWRTAFTVFIVPALVCAFLVPSLPDRQSGRPANVLSGLRRLLTSRTILLAGLAAGFYCILKYSYQAWMPVLLMRSCGLDAGEAGLMGTCFLLAGIAGPYLGGMFSDFWAHRDPAGCVKAAAFCTALVVVSKLVFYWLIGRVVMPVLFAAGMLDGVILMMPIPIYISIVQDIVDEDCRSSVMGLFGTIIFLSGGAWGPLLVGTFSDALGGGASGLLQAMTWLLVFGALSVLLYLACLASYRQEKRTADPTGVSIF